MQRMTAIAFLAVVCNTALFGQTAGKADEGAVRELVSKYVDARNGRDAEATRALFTKDADQLVSSGEWRRGIDALVKGAMASSQKENAKSSITLQAVRFLDKDLAIADGLYETSAAATGATRKMKTTLICQRTGQGWRIAAIRNMLPSAH